MPVFFLISDQPPNGALEDVLRYTRRDHFLALPGFQVVTSHWHFAYTEQAIEKGFDWTPPFKPVLKQMGVNAAIIMDFHGDGHPRDLTNLRLKELEAYFRACRAQSDSQFLLIPSEEANVHLGGHWALIFPKPVYWFMDRPAATNFLSNDPRYGPSTTPATLQSSSIWCGAKAATCTRRTRAPRAPPGSRIKSATRNISATRTILAEDGKPCRRTCHRPA